MLRDRAFVWIQFLAQNDVGMEGDGGEGGGIGKRSGQEEDGAVGGRGEFSPTTPLFFGGVAAARESSQTTVDTEAA